MKRRNSVAMVVCAVVLWGGAMCVPAEAQEPAAEKSAAVEAPRHLDGAWVQCVMRGAQGVQVEWFYGYKGQLFYYPGIHDQEPKSPPPAAPKQLRNVNAQEPLEKATEAEDEQGRYWYLAQMVYKPSGNGAAFWASTCEAAENYTLCRSLRHEDAPGVLRFVRQVGKVLSCAYEGVCIVRTRREGSENKVVSVNIYMP